MKYGKQERLSPELYTILLFHFGWANNHLGQKPGCGLCPLSIDHLHSILAQMFPLLGTTPLLPHSPPSLPQFTLSSGLSIDEILDVSFRSPFLTPKCTVDTSLAISRLCVINGAYSISF